MSFNSVSRNDLEKIKSLQPDGWSDITKEFEFYIEYDFCFTLKKESNGKILAIGASISFEKSAWLAHIIVDKDYRNKGIGNGIVKELISRLKELKSIETYMLIATEIGRPVYLKSGFRDVDNYLFMKRGQPWKGKPVSEKIFDFKKEYRSAIYDLDFDVSGEKREILLEPHLASSKVFIENNRLTGYYLPGLREGLIYGQTEEAGTELMNLKYARSDKAVIPSLNIAGIEFLKQNGFIEDSVKGTRMVLGKELDWKPKNIFSRISGNFG